MSDARDQFPGPGEGTRLTDCGVITLFLSDAWLAGVVDAARHLTLVGYLDRRQHRIGEERAGRHERTPSTGDLPGPPSTSRTTARD